MSLDRDVREKLVRALAEAMIAHAEELENDADAEPAAPRAAL